MISLGCQVMPMMTMIVMLVSKILTNIQKANFWKCDYANPTARDVGDGHAEEVWAHLHTLFMGRRRICSTRQRYH